MTMSEKYVDDIWNLLKFAVQNILTKKFERISWEELYRYSFQEFMIFCRTLQYLIGNSFH